MSARSLMTTVVIAVGGILLFEPFVEAIDGISVFTNTAFVLDQIPLLLALLVLVFIATEIIPYVD